MEKRVELEMRGKTPGEVVELNLDNCRATQVAGITDEFKNLEFLSLINVGLTTLKGFPNLPSLKKLELSDNRLTGGFEHLSGCSSITHLNLSGNKLKDVEVLEPLKNLPKLKSLDLFNCEVTSQDGYREKVFETLKQLKYLDGFDKEEKECDDSEDGLGDDDDEDEVDDAEDGTDGEDGDDGEPGLAYLQSDRAVHDEDETEDFEPGENEADEDDDDIDDEEEESSGGRGAKRKFEDDASN
jgi:hypothetical protein